MTVEPGVVLERLERLAQGPGPVLPGRHLDRQPRHDRRHGGQQQLRRALLALRQHGPQRARDRRDPGRRDEGALRRDRRQFRRGHRLRIATATSCARCARSTAARRTRSMRRFPKLLRRVGGYNIDMIDDAGHNMAHLLVGSEGTLAFFTAIELELQPIPPHKVLGICHFPSFYRAMAATKAIVALGSHRGRTRRPHHDRARARHRHVPADRRALRPGRARGALLVEFAGEDVAANTRGLARLVELMGDLGFPGARRSRRPIPPSSPPCGRCAPTASTS